MTTFDDNFWWHFFMTIFDVNFWWQFLMTIENLNSDNHSYLTINCDTGQHSQFLRCFLKFSTIWSFHKSLSWFSFSVIGSVDTRLLGWIWDLLNTPPAQHTPLQQVAQFSSLLNFGQFSTFLNFGNFNYFPLQLGFVLESTFL